jgi:hypothetical protein
MKTGVKYSLLSISLCLTLCACKHLFSKPKELVSYSELKAEKNYYDSIPGKVRVRDYFCSYRYYLDGDPYTGRVEDYFRAGHPKLKGSFKDGYPTGRWLYYLDNDSLQRAGEFENGYAKGEWNFFDKKGTKIQQLIYTVKGRHVSTDTLIITYDDGSHWEKRDSSFYHFYPDGKTAYILNADGSAGTFMDKNGNVTAEMTDFIKKNLITHEITYYVNHGANEKAYRALIASYDKWTEAQKLDFIGANSVTVGPRSMLPKASILSQFQVHVH